MVFIIYLLVIILVFFIHYKITGRAQDSFCVALLWPITIIFFLIVGPFAFIYDFTQNMPSKCSVIDGKFCKFCKAEKLGDETFVVDVNICKKIDLNINRIYKCIDKNPKTKEK